MTEDNLENRIGKMKKEVIERLEAEKEMKLKEASSTSEYNAKYNDNKTGNKVNKALAIILGSAAIIGIAIRVIIPVDNDKDRKKDSTTQYQQPQTVRETTYNVLPYVENHNLRPLVDNIKPTNSVSPRIVFTPEIGHLYVVNDSALYYDSEVQFYSGSKLKFLLNENNIHEEYYLIRPDRFTDLYNQNKVKDLGYKNKNDIINSITHRRDSVIFKNLQPKTRLGRFWQKYREIQYEYGHH